MKNYFSSFVLFLILFLSVLVSYAAKGKISGYVFDNTTNKPIPDANVMLSNTNFGAASKDGGFYFIDKIPQEKYDITVKVIGYESAIKKAVEIGENTFVNFYLKPKAIEFDPIIVTATLSDHLQSRVSVASEILTQPRLREKTGNTVGEIIESVGSIYFNSYDGLAGNQIASIRGSNVDQVVVLLDGLRLNTAQGGGVDLNSMPVSALERIEVVRGGHSTLMGSDAIGGAIQLISRETIGMKRFSYGLNATLGSFGTKILNLFGFHQIGRLSSFLDYNRTQSDGDFSYKTPATGEKSTRVNNDYLGNNLFLKTKFDLSEKTKLQVIFQNLQTEKGVAGSVNLNPWTNESMLTPNARAEMDRKLLSLKSENQITDRVRVEGQTYYQTYDYHYKDPDGWLPTDDEHKNSALGLNLQGQMSVSSNIFLIGGAEIRQDRLKSTKFRVEDRNIQSLYAQTEIRVPLSLFSTNTQWTSIPAIRWDNYSDVDAQVSPKLGILINSGEKISMGFRCNIGKSYRVPTFDDLYWPDEGWAKGNPDLKPETSTSFDFGLFLNKKSNAFIQAEVNYFSNTIDDLISWGADNSGIWMPLNIGKANIEGIETGVKYRLSGNIAHLNIFHTWMKATDETPNSISKGKHLIYRPDNKLDIVIGSNLGLFSVNLNYRLVSKRYISADNSKSLSDYSLLNGNIRYSLSFTVFNVAAKLQVLNILDNSIYITDGYPIPGREIRFSLSFIY